jgi:hypothetical protein
MIGIGAIIALNVQKTIAANAYRREQEEAAAKKKQAEKDRAKNEQIQRGQNKFVNW